MAALGILFVATIVGAVLGLSGGSPAYAIGSGSMAFSPASQSQFQGTQFSFAVTGTNDAPLGAFDLVFTYDSSLVTYLSGGAVPTYLAST